MNLTFPKAERLCGSLVSLIDSYFQNPFINLLRVSRVKFHRERETLSVMSLLNFYFTWKIEINKMISFQFSRISN